MTHFETAPQELDLPDLDQLMQYRDLMVGIVRNQGKGIRYAREGEVANTHFGTDYMLPGLLTEWSDLDDKLRSRILRDRCYSASFRPLGEKVGRLLVLETDSELVNPTTYMTKRNMYKFSFAEHVGVFEASVLPNEIISRSQFAFIGTPDRSHGIKDLLIFDQEESSANAENGMYERYINMFGEPGNTWAQVGQEDFTNLIERSTDYGNGWQAVLEANAATNKQAHTK